MKPRKTLGLLLVLLSCWLAPPAHGQPAADDDQATSLVQQAARAYDENQLDEALRLLARAYELSPRPSILYNQAQVLRAKDDCGGALEAYRRFLDTAAPDDGNRERAARRRDEMQACVQRRSPPPAPKLAVAPATQPPAVVISAPARPVEPEHPEGHRRALRAGGWALLGVGVAAAGAAAVFAWRAHDLQNELNDELHMPMANRLIWDGALATRAADGQNDATRAWWCAGLAALAGGGSATLFILSRPPAGDDAAQRHAALLGWSGTF